MVSHVYFAFHSKWQAFKAGKANVIASRFAQIGISSFNIERSFALEVADELTANNLESIFHRIFRNRRWMDPTDLPPDGIGEWFSTDCLIDIDNLFESLSGHFEFKKIPIVICEKSLPSRGLDTLQKIPQIKDSIYPSKLDSLVCSVNYLIDWLEQVKNDYPDISIGYIEDGGAIEFRGCPESFALLAEPLRIATSYKWQEVSSYGEIKQATGSVVRSVTTTRYSRRGEVDGVGSKKQFPIKRVRLNLSFNCFSSENLPENMRNFIDRWSTLS